MPKILVVSSNIHSELAAEQLKLCTILVESAGYTYQVESIQAGVYEIPFVISTYHQQNPFDAYIALGLILKADLDHYSSIMNHVRYCFSKFALSNIIIGNGIISAETKEDLATKIRSSNPCDSAYPSAFAAVDCLVKIKNRFN